MLKHGGKLAWFVAVVGLLCYEAWALATGGETLSRAMWEMTEAFGVLPFLVGLVAGGLAVHFWWRWDPRAGRKGGG